MAWIKLNARQLNWNVNWVGRCINCPYLQTDRHVIPNGQHW